MAGKRHVRFSLYLSSQLMFGLIAVNNMKSSILLDEIRTLAARMRSFHPELTSVIDLTEPVSSLRVTLDELDLENAPFDFGFFPIIDESEIPYSINEYFIVPTPQSTPESTPQMPLLSEQVRTGDVGDEHTAREEDITMQEEAPIQREEFQRDDNEEEAGGDFSLPLPAPEAELIQDVLNELVLQAEALPENGIDEVSPERGEVVAEQLPPEQLPPHLEPEPEADLPVIEQDVPNGIQAVPIVGPDAAEPRRDEDRRSRSTDHTSSPSEQEEGRARASSTPVAFVLEPVPTRGRGRRRRRHLIIDRRIEIPRNIIQRNIETSDRLLRPLTLPSLQESAESMLSRFGLRAAAHGSKRFWRNPQTLPEPDDPARFGFFGEESTETPSHVLAEETVMTGVSMDELRAKSREERRADDTGEESREVTQVDLSGLPSRASRVSRILQESRDRDQRSSTAVSAMSFLPGMPDISVPDLSGIRTEFDEYAVIQPEPEPSVEPHILPPAPQREIETEEQELPIEPVAELLPVPQDIVEPAVQPELPGEAEELPQRVTEPDREPEPSAEPETEPGASVRRKRKRICLPRPREEKTPPPPSPSLPTSPLLERTMMYIVQAINENPNHEETGTSCNAVIDKTPRRRKYVAKLCREFLNLHECGAIILEQKESVEKDKIGEVMIHTGPRFDEYSPE